MGDPASDLVQRLVEATEGRCDGAGLRGRVAFGIGSSTVTMEFIDGRVAGPSDAAPQVVISITGKQFDAWASGALSLTVAYMQGDVKPEGSTRALLAALEVLDSAEVLAAIS